MKPKRTGRAVRGRSLPVPSGRQTVIPQPIESTGLEQLAAEVALLRRNFTSCVLIEGPDKFVEQTERLADFMRRVRALADKSRSLAVLEVLVEALWKLEGLDDERW